MNKLIPDDELICSISGNLDDDPMETFEDRRCEVRRRLWEWLERCQAESDRIGVKDDGYHAVSTVVQMLK